MQEEPRAPSPLDDAATKIQAAFKGHLVCSASEMFTEISFVSRFVHIRKSLALIKP